MRTFAYRLVRDDLMLFVCGRAAISESEWSEYMQQVAAASARLRPVRRTLRFLVFFGASGPNAKQRAAIVEAMGGVTSKTAVITTNTVARNVITVFSWLGVTSKGFSPSELDSAANYLDLPPAFLEQAMDAGRALAPSIGGAPAFEAAERARYGHVSPRP